MLTIVAVLDSTDRADLAFASMLWFQDGTVTVVILTLFEVVSLPVLLIILRVVTLVTLENEAWSIFLAVLIQLW